MDVPDGLVKSLPDDRPVQVIIIVNESDDDEEDAAWSRLAAEHFLAQYNDVDAIYDRLYETEVKS